jgi:hypothetical protein
MSVNEMYSLKRYTCAMPPTTVSGTSRIESVPAASDPLPEMAAERSLVAWTSAFGEIFSSGTATRSTCRFAEIQTSPAFGCSGSSVEDRDIEHTAEG